MALLWRVLAPSCRKMAPRWANIAQKSAKRGQDSQEAADLRAARSAVSSSFLVFSCVFFGLGGFGSWGLISSLFS